MKSREQSPVPHGLSFCLSRSAWSAQWLLVNTACPKWVLMLTLLHYIYFFSFIHHIHTSFLYLDILFSPSIFLYPFTLTINLGSAPDVSLLLIPYSPAPRMYLAPTPARLLNGDQWCGTMS